MSRKMSASGPGGSTDRCPAACAPGRAARAILARRLTPLAAEEDAPTEAAPAAGWDSKRRRTTGGSPAPVRTRAWSSTTAARRLRRFCWVGVMDGHESLRVSLQGEGGEAHAPDKRPQNRKQQTDQKDKKDAGHVGVGSGAGEGELPLATQIVNPRPHSRRVRLRSFYESSAHLWLSAGLISHDARSVRSMGEG